VIQKVIGATTIWSGEAFVSFKNASALAEANALFDIVDMFEEREMRTAESWLFLETGTKDFGGPA